MLANDLQIILMAMSGVLYKRTLHEDESPLPIHDSEDGNADIEMDDLGQEGDVNDFAREELPIPTQTVYKSRRREVCYFIWALMTTLFLLITIIIAAVVHKPGRAIHWCCVNNEEMAKCENMSIAFQIERFKPLFTCIRASSISACVDKINSDLVDVVNIPNRNLYEHKDVLQPIMAEDYQNTPGEVRTYVVAVANKSMSLVNLSHSGLSNLSMCVMKSDVTLLFGFMHDKKIINSSVCKRHGKSVCFHDFPDMNRAGLACLSSHITVATTPKGCQSSSFHVKIIDHLTMNKLIDTSDDSPYELLCPNGSRASLGNYKSCNLLWKPLRSLVVSSKMRSGVDIYVPTSIVEVLHVAQLYFGPHSQRNFNMFASGNKKNLLFQDATEKLVPLQNNCTAQNYLGKDFVRYMDRAKCVKSKNATYESCWIPQYN